jgi:hypothetical protein
MIGGFQHFQGATMLRKIVCAVVVTTVGLGMALADDFTANISKVDGNKVTFKKTGKKGDPPGDEMTLPVKDGAKITKGMFNKDSKKVEPGEAIEGGLKSDTFTKIGDKGLVVSITTDDGNKNITAITTFGGGGKGKGKKGAGN